MRVSHFNRPFCKLVRDGCIWYLGYNTHTKEFVKYSDTNGPGYFEAFMTIDELRTIYNWFLANGWKLVYEYEENILEYA